MKLSTLTLAFTAIVLAACASNPQPEQPPQREQDPQWDPTSQREQVPPREQVSAPSQMVAQRPEWTMNEPEITDDRMYFVGLSALHATEQSARDGARRNAADAAVQYLGNLAKSKFQEASRSYGLESAVVDAETSALSFQKQMAANVVNRQKSHKWYMEREADASGRIGYKMFVLTSMPTAEIDKVFDDTVRENIADARQKQQEAMTEEAKRQGQLAEEFWQSVQDQDESFFQ